MMKQISVMKRHPDLTMEEFVRLYESYHVKFGEALFAKAQRYVRRYVQPERNPLTGETVEMDFDRAARGCSPHRAIPTSR